MFGKKQPKPEPNANILVITGDLNMNYQIIDSVFAMESHSGMIFGGDPSKAFGGVRAQLREKAIAVGGNAVINCAFEYRVSVEAGLLGAKQVMEIFAYGTVVRTV
jgi:hypothetical protein|tara:strand:+ start:941 stop:1255 length:315 start_codon:yes stop_codon:yes gene_type:complete